LGRTGCSGKERGERGRRFLQQGGQKLGEIFWGRLIDCALRLRSGQPRKLLGWDFGLRRKWSLSGFGEGKLFNMVQAVELDILLAQAVADKLERDRSLLQIPIDNIDRWLNAGTPSTREPFLKWRKLLEQALVDDSRFERVLEILRSEKEEDRWWIDFSPFAGVLSVEERRSIIHQCPYSHYPLKLALELLMLQQMFEIPLICLKFFRGSFVGNFFEGGINPGGAIVKFGAGWFEIDHEVALHLA
jgi:hypothetical protein